MTLDKNGQSWIALEDGIEVQFAPTATGKTQFYTGDYWLIPARVATGGIDWPQTKGADGTVGPAAELPRGIEHHLAPLAVVQAKSGEALKVIVDNRHTFPSLTGF